MKRQYQVYRKNLLYSLNNHTSFPYRFQYSVKKKYQLIFQLGYQPGGVGGGGGTPYDGL